MCWFHLQVNPIVFVPTGLHLCQTQLLHCGIYQSQVVAPNWLLQMICSLMPRAAAGWGADWPGLLLGLWLRATDEVEGLESWEQGGFELWTWLALCGGRVCVCVSINLWEATMVKAFQPMVVDSSEMHILHTIQYYSQLFLKQLVQYQNAKVVLSEFCDCHYMVWILGLSRIAATQFHLLITKSISQNQIGTNTILFTGFNNLWTCGLVVSLLAWFFQPVSKTSPAELPRRDKFLKSQEKFIERLGGQSRLDEVASDFSNMVHQWHLLWCGIGLGSKGIG